MLHSNEVLIWNHLPADESPPTENDQIPPSPIEDDRHAEPFHPKLLRDPP